MRRRGRTIVNSGWLPPAPAGWEDVLKLSLSEDLGSGDISASLLPDDLKVDWYIEAQADGVLCGAGIAYDLLSGDDDIVCHLQDGAAVSGGSKILSGTSPAQTLLTLERTALNFLMHLSGVASLTRRFVDAVKGTNARIVDTRKTLPGMRVLDKYAVRCGGGSNHRMGLFDGVMIKDNHLRALGGITRAVALAKASAHHLLKIEVECETLDQVAEAVAAGAEVVMLDNMSLESMQTAVDRYRGKAVLEASGGVNLATVRSIAETGVDLISVGAITHSANALPFHLEVQ